MMEEEKGNLKKFYEKLTFLSSLKNANLAEWQEELMKEIWDLQQGRSSTMNWTDANLTKILKEKTKKYEDIIIALISGES